MDAQMQRSEVKLAEFTRRLHEAAGNNLQSIVLYGSAARGDYRERRSDLNLLCVLHSAKAGDLARLARVIHWWSGELKEPPPQFFTPEELRHSADVFSIELLDIGQNHKILFGSDPIAGLDVPMNLHRIEIEHDLRALLHKLRIHFVHYSENEAQLREIYAKSISGMTVLLRHVLIAFGEDVPVDRNHLYRRIEELTGAEASTFELGHALRENHHATEIPRAFGKYLEAISAVIHALDAIVPKREWQRLRKSRE
jgi:predicted nucleotidyltransferase